jgi:hypothetical protein
MYSALNRTAISMLYLDYFEDFRMFDELKGWLILISLIEIAKNDFSAHNVY